MAKPDQELDLIFAELFSSDNGKIVLQALERSVLEADPYCIGADFQTDSLFREGGRQMLQYIYSRIDNINK